jgi:hypothetical protein
MSAVHDPLCGQFCDGKPPKCRGGDCTLCDEVDCSCDLIARVRADERQRARQRVEALYDDHDWPNSISDRDRVAAAAAGGDA